MMPWVTGLLACLWNPQEAQNVQMHTQMNPVCPLFQKVLTRFNKRKQVAQSGTFVFSAMFLKMQTVFVSMSGFRS